MIDGKKLVFVSILRAGNGMLDGMLELVPARARRPHRPLPRSRRRWSPSSTTSRCPSDMAERDVIVVDPMLATGNSAVAARRPAEGGAAAVDQVRLPARRARRRRARCSEAHPDVPIYTAAVDEQLNEHGYIVPGLGDAGDRLFGTK